MDISLNICIKPPAPKVKAAPVVNIPKLNPVKKVKGSVAPFQFIKKKNKDSIDPNKQKTTQNIQKPTKPFGKKPESNTSQNNNEKSNFNPKYPQEKSQKKFPLFSGHTKEKELSDDEIIPEKKENVFGSTVKSLKEMNVHDFMLQYLEKKGITKATAIQQKTIPKILNGENLMIRSETGSGKTLAYAIPIVHALSSIRPKISRKDGIQVVVVVPTRELALQTLEVFKDLVYSYCWLVPGHVSGGENRKAEKARLRKGLNILIGTPGRLMDHFLHSASLTLDNVRCLVIDEADSLVEMGHKEDIKKIVTKIEDSRNNTYDPMALLKGNKKTNFEETSEGMPLKDPNSKRMQTLFLSATLSKKVEELKDLVLKDYKAVEAEPNINMSETSNVTAPNMKQKYVVTDIKTRLVVLSSLIVNRFKEKNCKIFIFMDTRQMVDFHEALLKKCLFSTDASQFDVNETLNMDDSDEETAVSDISDIKLFKIHGDMNQKERTATYKDFRKANKGILLCTDAAARGIDVPNADYVIQYTAPLKTDVYLHRIGRTARAGKSGESIIFVTEPEMEYISHVKRDHNVNIEREMEDDILEYLMAYMSHINPHNMRVAAEALQKRFEEAIDNDKKLLTMACMAYMSWYRYYRMFPGNLRQYFNANNLHQGHYIASFGLRLNLAEIKKAVRKDFDETTAPEKKLNMKLSNNAEEERKQLPPKMPQKRSRTKDLVMSEYDSGISSKKRKNV